MKETEADILLKDVEAIFAKKNTRQQPSKFNEQVSDFVNFNAASSALDAQEKNALLGTKQVTRWFYASLLFLGCALIFKVYKQPEQLKMFFLKQESWNNYLPEAYNVEQTDNETLKLIINHFNKKDYNKVAAVNAETLNFIFEKEYNLVLKAKLNALLRLNRTNDCFTILNELKKNNKLHGEIKLYEAIFYLQLGKFDQAKSILKEIPSKDKYYSSAQSILTQFH